MEQLNTIDQNIEQLMSTFLRKPTLIKGVIYLVLMLYAARVAPKPPQAVLDLFENQYFKLFFFALILWTAQFSPSTSLLIAVAFLITMNYFGQKALWEFMDNTESSETSESSLATAPTKDVALETSAAIIEAQTENPPVVQTMEQTSETVVIQPTIIQTENGTTLQNPTVVVAPAVIETENGEKLLVKPDVTVVEVPQEKPTPEPSVEIQESAPGPAPAPAPEPTSAPAPEQQAAINAVSVLAAGAASQEPSSPEQISKVAEIAAASLTTEQGLEAVKTLAEQAVQPAAAEPEAVKEIAFEAIKEIMSPPTEQPKAEETGCYPIRKYDMSKVEGYSVDNFYGNAK
jgi:hypothetical protein